MSSITRRGIVQGGLAAAGTMALPRLARSQARPAKTVKVAGYIDIANYDPIVSSAYTTLHHGLLVYDTLFSFDSQMRAQPQMVSKYHVSDDKLTYTFQLRDGLKWHDGTPVTTADIVPSIRRWGAKTGWGPLMFERVKDVSAKDATTFTIQLRDRFGLVLDALARDGFMMRKKEAESDSSKYIETAIGSGPFRFNPNETRSGTRYVYDRNPDYVPRKEAPDNMAGGKVVKVDRIVYEIMGDPQTALAALQAGEVDFNGEPPLDFIDQLSKDRNLKVEVVNPLGQAGFFRFNCIQPPFNNVKNRQAMLHLINQIDYLKANFASPAYYKTCAAWFGCGTPMENDANTDWFKTAPNIAKAKQLLKEGGYDGKPVVILQGTDWSVSRNASEILAQQMRRAGMNAEVVAIDRASVFKRRASKAPPDQGGWNVFATTSSTIDYNSPAAIYYATNGDKGWWGWPTDAKNDELRNKWVRAETTAERNKIAREIQANAWDIVTHATFGQWVQPVAMRANIKGVLPTTFAWARVWWNVEKT